MDFHPYGDWMKWFDQKNMEKIWGFRAMNPAIYLWSMFQGTMGEVDENMGLALW